jgi:UDP:flavonoid glycosyltransferase YjiC (YdhE family)
MKASIVTWGSRGDFQPYLALAVGLREAGHEVRLAARPGPGFAELAAAHGIEFSPLGEEVESGVLQETANEAIETSNPVKAVRLIMDQMLLPEIDGIYEQCLEFARWSDVVVSHFFLFTGRMAAEAARRPFVSGTLVPTQIPTSTSPPGELANIAPVVNRLLWKVAVAYMNAGWLGPINETRQRHGLRPVADVAGDGFYSPGLNLIAFSPRIHRRPKDWPAKHQMTGYWMLKPQKAWTPSAEVDRFFKSGEPPIAVGFGSMTSRDNQELTMRVLRAIKHSRVRAILEPGLAGLGEAVLPPGVLVADNLPHSWLLPRLAALVHHGGAGTAAAVFHAGVPSIFVPHVFDQHVWASRAAKLGVSPEPIPARKLTSKALVDAIQTVVGDGRMWDRAVRLGEKLREERGVERAVTLIEEYVESGRVSGRMTERALS